MPYFDNNGWHTDTVLDGRHTDVPLPDVPLAGGMGWQWTGYVWMQMPTAQPVFDVPPVARHITKRAFWNRLPPAKEVAMRAVMRSGDTAHIILAASLDRLAGRVDASPFVDLDDDETIGGMALLASAAVPDSVTIAGQTLPLRLTAAERDAVLTAPVQPREAYKG